MLLRTDINICESCTGILQGMHPRNPVTLGVLSSSPAGFGSCSEFPFKLAAVPPGSAPVMSRPHRVNPPVAKQVGHDANLSSTNIWPLASLNPRLLRVRAPWLSYPNPVMFASPFVHRWLNKLCELRQLPIPRVDYALDKLLHEKNCSLFDMKSSFHQTTVHRGTIALTRFTTSNGLVEWHKMPQGSAAAPGRFCKVVNEVTRTLTTWRPSWTI